jgi:uncharacterized protein (TIGR03435 family)
MVASITTAVFKGSISTTSTLGLIKTTLKIMAWTKAKTAMVIGAGMLLAAGTATVAIKEITVYRTYPWQVRNVNTGVLNQVPPQVHIVSSKFPQSGGWGASDDKVLGIGQTLQTILLVAYEATSPYRIISPAKLPEDKYDFIANLPENSRLALQKELKRKFGLSANHQARQTNVLRLSVKKAGAAGLRPSASDGGSAESSAGHFSCLNQPLSCLTSMLEDHFKVPVVDQTGLKGHFDIDLDWDQPEFQQKAPEALKQALVDELGLDLLPAMEAVDMLIVQQSK